jgi:hypothetical protein
MLTVNLKMMTLLPPMPLQLCKHRGFLYVQKMFLLHPPAIATDLDMNLI